MTGVVNDRGLWFVDTHVSRTRPRSRSKALQASYRLKLFGIEPKVALISHSNFGSHDDDGANKMRQALQLIIERAPNLEVDGEMHVDAALDPIVRERLLPGSRLKGSANLFVFPNLDSANIAYNMVRVLTDGVALGPILMGVSKPAHVLTTPAVAPGGEHDRDRRGRGRSASSVGGARGLSGRGLEAPMASPRGEGQGAAPRSDPPATPHSLPPRGRAREGQEPGHPGSSLPAWGRRGGAGPLPPARPLPPGPLLPALAPLRHQPQRNGGSSSRHP